MSIALIRALEERHRQVNEKGFDAANDDAYAPGVLASAAESYARAACWTQVRTDELPPPPTIWPWHDSTWKPSADPKRNIEKSIALLMAEYERIVRTEAAAVVNAEPEPVWSNNGEEFYDEISSAITDHQAGDTILIGDTKRFSGSDFIRTSTDEVIERMQEAASEEMGEFAETYLDEVDGDQAHPARQLLDAFIDAWADEYGQPSFWGVQNVREYVITAEDIEEAAHESA